MKTDRDYLYQSPPRKIGRREWRVVVYDARGYLGASVFTDYEWRYPAFSNIEATAWESMQSYPTYDSNDGMYAGCPQTLRKLYNLHRTEIDAAIAKAKEAGF